MNTDDDASANKARPTTLGWIATGTKVLLGLVVTAAALAFLIRTVNNWDGGGHAPSAAGGAPTTASHRATTVYDVIGELDERRKGGKMTTMDAIIWQGMPRPPQGGRWRSDGEKMHFEDCLKFTVDNNLSDLSKPTARLFVQLKDTYEERGLE